MSFCKEFNAKTAGFLVRDDPLTTSIVVVNILLAKPLRR
jgi:hypothetical protein